MNRRSLLYRLTALPVIAALRPILPMIVPTPGTSVADSLIMPAETGVLAELPLEYARAEEGEYLPWTRGLQRPWPLGPTHPGCQHIICPNVLMIEMMVKQIRDLGPCDHPITLRSLGPLAVRPAYRFRFTCLREDHALAPYPGMVIGHDLDINYSDWCGDPPIAGRRVVIYGDADQFIDAPSPAAWVPNIWPRPEYLRPALPRYGWGRPRVPLLP